MQSAESRIFHQLGEHFCYALLKGIALLNKGPHLRRPFQAHRIIVCYVVTCFELTNFAVNNRDLSQRLGVVFRSDHFGQIEIA